jgi:death-on-curing protein
LFDWAAAYAHGIANNPPFVDGNKRTAFVAAALFLESNGWRVVAPEEEVVRMVLGVADKSVPQEAVAQWLGDQTQPVK